MKLRFSFFVVFFLVYLGMVSGRAAAQRFTSNPQIVPARINDDSGDQDARQAYLALKAGKLDDARKYLAEADSSSPFAMYVQAGLTGDAARAANIYEEIAAQNPNKPIGREALLQLYKLHFAAGDYGTAHREYLQLRKYPEYARLTDPAGLEDSLQTPKALPMPVASNPPVVTSPSESGSFVVQVGVFSTPENAQKFVKSLEGSGFSGTVFTKMSSGKTLYAVSAGSFSTREEAQAFAENLKSRSIDCIVVQR